MNRTGLGRTAAARSSPRSRRFRLHIHLCALVSVAACPAAAQDLIAIEADTTNLYRVSPASGSLALIGSTGVPSMGSLEAAPDGFLYGVTTGDAPILYRINPTDAATTAVGPLGIGFVFEGALALAPDGRAFGTNQNNASVPNLFQIDLATGSAVVVATMSGGLHDINGLAWRPDGLLVGLDRVNDGLVAIDPSTGATSSIATLGTTVGGVGGMAVLGDVAYFSTGGPNPPLGSPGTNSLFRVDLFTGARTLVGSFSPTVAAAGISGLAPGPRPCDEGTVNASLGSPVDVLFLSGTPGDSTRTFFMTVGQPVELTLYTAPMGPSPSRYALWVWAGGAVNATPLRAGALNFGCTVNPTPLDPLRAPQPIRCLRGAGVPRLACGSTTERLGPASAPWFVGDPRGLPRPMVLSIQAAIEDASSRAGGSVTNAITIVVQ